MRNSRENPKCPEKHPSQGQSVHHKSNMRSNQACTTGSRRATLPYFWILSAVKILAHDIVRCGRFRMNTLPTSSDGLHKSEIPCLQQAPHRVPWFSSVSHANPRGRYQRQVGHDTADAVTMVTRDSHITGLALPCAIDTHIRGQHALWRAVRGQV
jgi:hypothetical protein